MADSSAYGASEHVEAPEPTLTDTFLDLDVDDGWARDMAASLALVPDGGGRGAGLGAPSDADGSGGSHGTSRGTDSRSLTSSRDDLGGGCGGDGYLSPDSVMPGHHAATGGPFPFFAFALRSGARAAEARRDAGLDGALLLTATGTLFDDLSESEDASEDADGMPYGGAATARRGGGSYLFPDLTARGDGAPNQLRLDVGAVLNAWRCAGGHVAPGGEVHYSSGGGLTRPQGGSLCRQLPSPYARPAPPKAPTRSTSGRPLRGAAAAAAEAVAAVRSGGVPRSRDHHQPRRPQQPRAPPPQPRVPMLLRLEDAPGYAAPFGGQHNGGHGGAVPAGAMSPQEDDGVTRGDRVERFLKKRRERQFVTKVRYEVRKLNAEARPRFKGRFVKTDETY